jgi:hypothetical protein
MRYIFVDEAGTSDKEPVTVVVGIIADADKHVVDADNLVKEVLGAVPDKFSKDFVFHATQVFNDKEYQKYWSMTDRLKLLYSMMSIPKKIGMAITVSVTWRRAVDYSDIISSLDISQSQMEHIVTFANCLCIADRNIRNHAGHKEVATVVAEDIPEMRRYLKNIPKMYRDGIHLSPEHLRETISDKEAGYTTQSGEMRITRIRNSVYFADKSEDPLVQVADALAYGFRRYFSKQKFGEEFINAILGDLNLVRNFQEPGGTECWWPKDS